MINHPDRVSLHNEVHARPRPPLAGPHRVSHFALLRGAAGEPRDPSELAALCRDYHLTPRAAGQSHFFGDFGAFRIKWERHGEFDDYTVYRAGADAARPFAEPAIEALPKGWVDSLPGQTIAAVHVGVLAGGDAWREPVAADARFGADEFVGARLADETAGPND
jgi:uncharacterized membrane-anchored protein